MVKKTYFDILGECTMAIMIPDDITHFAETPA
jgi:hypothetical protein